MTTATWNNTRSWSFEAPEVKAAREAAESAAHQARLEAERKAHMAFRIKRDLPTYQGIANALQNKTVAGEVVFDAENLTITVKGIRVYFDVSEERTSISTWRSRPNGKVRITVGDYGNKTSYPQRKDGTHNYGAIATTLLNDVEQKIVQGKADAARKANAAIVPTLRREYDFKYEYSGQGIADVNVGPSSTVDKPVSLTFKYAGSVTVERAKEIMDALKALGLM